MKPTAAGLQRIYTPLLVVTLLVTAVNAHAREATQAPISDNAVEVQENPVTNYPQLGQAIPNWVDAIPAFTTPASPQGGPSEGVRYRLVDDQRNELSSEQPALFFAIELDLMSARAVANESMLRMKYRHDYQQLIVNKVLIKRGDQIIDALPSATHRTLDLEPELQSLIITGGRELLLTLKDVQVGDRLYYAYTIIGTNPVYDGIREHVIQTNYGVSVDKINFRLLVDKDDKLALRRHNLKALPTYHVQDNFAEYRMQFNNLAPIRTASDKPNWYDPNGLIVFSDIHRWSDVVDWGLPMYHHAIDTTNAVSTVAQSIMDTHSSKEDRIGAALTWTQHNIRYLGIETGVNSHKPRNANRVIEQGFGDCKDKTVVLVSLLNVMGIKASPALVNSEGTTRNTNMPMRLHAFDHVVTHLNIDGIDHWLDPTMTSQTGTLGSVFEPDYGKALILDEGQDSLVDMYNPMSGIKKRIAKIIKADAAADATATLKIQTYSSGYNAERTRRNFEDNTTQSISLGFRDYYRDQFDQLTIAEPLSIKHYPKNRNMVTEQYHLGVLWNDDQDGEEPYRWFNSDEVQSYLKTPENPNYREEPFDITFPASITEVYSLHLENIEADYIYEDTFESPWFELSAYYNQNALDNILNTSWVLTTKQRTVYAEDIEAYVNAVNEASDWLSFYVTSSGFYMPNDDETGPEASQDFSVDADVLTAVE